MIVPELGPASNDGTDPSQPPRIAYYNMGIADDNLSHLLKCSLSGFELGSVGGKAAPMWTRPFPGKVESVLFAVLPVGWTGEWHDSPKPQWVVSLSGRWFIETQDGNRVEMGPGDIHWGQDIGGKDIDGNSGHRSGQIGSEPCVHLMLQFEPMPTVTSGCTFD
jgi:hypothetical protein